MALRVRFRQGMRRLFEDESGSYTLEMAFVMPLYLMLIFGFTSAALLLFVYCEATYACRTAVRFASVHSAAVACNAGSSAPCTAADIKNVLINAMPTINGGTFSPPVLSYGTTGPITGNAVGSTVSIGVQISYSAGLPYMRSSPITLSSSAQSYIFH